MEVRCCGFPVLRTAHAVDYAEHACFKLRNLFDDIEGFADAGLLGIETSDGGGDAGCGLRGGGEGVVCEGAGGNDLCAEVRADEVEAGESVGEAGLGCEEGGEAGGYGGVGGVEAVEVGVELGGSGAGIEGWRSWRERGFV